MLKVQLTRDLRKNILRGHPWIYREAIKEPKKGQEPCLCEVLDKKKQGVAWAIYSPEGPLALRGLSTQRKPPNQKFFSDRMHEAWLQRQSLRSEGTNAYRLWNGEGDQLPGLVCDIYNGLAVIQFDGSACFQFWDKEFIADWLLEKEEVQTVFCKPRRSDSFSGKHWGKTPDSQVVEILENGQKFLVDYVEGQKTGFFLDQRENRNYIKSISKGKKVLNLFSYSGGFSIYAGKGGATAVKSVDLSPQALELAQKAWTLNGLKSEKHETETADVFKFIESEADSYNVVIVDPPSMSHLEKTKHQAVKTYTDLFAKASSLVAPGDHLVLSSCSSHISFDDFLNIIDEALSQARRTGRILKISGQGPDHPFPHYCRELRYLKFVDLVLN